MKNIQKLSFGILAALVLSGVTACSTSKTDGEGEIVEVTGPAPKMTDEVSVDPKTPDTMTLGAASTGRSR